MLFDLLPLAAAPNPPFDQAYLVALASRVAHTLCAAIVFGGLLYLRLVLAPAVAGDSDATLFAGRRRTWALLVALATLLLLVSGFYNFFSFIRTYDNLPKLYHPLFGVKFLLSLGVLAIAALVGGKTALAERVRSGARGWLTLALLLAVGVFVCGAMLRSLRDVPGARSVPAASAAADAPAFKTTAEPLEVVDPAATTSPSE
jgi:putative copper export protein